MTQYRNLKPGDVVPLTWRRPFTGECEPAWWVLVTGRQHRAMDAASDWLRRYCDDAWYPVAARFEEVERNGRKQRIRTERPIIPGLVFALTGQWPQWDVLSEQRGIRPMLIGIRPVVITDAVMAQMAQVPQRIEDLRRAVAESERAEREARIPKVGDEVDFFGTVAVVEEIGAAGFRITMNGMKTWLPPGTEKRAKGAKQ